MVIQKATKQCLHFKHRELDFAGMNMKKTKRLCTATQEETCLSGDDCTVKMSFWGQLEDKRSE